MVAQYKDKQKEYKELLKQREALLAQIKQIEESEGFSGDSKANKLRKLEQEKQQLLDELEELTKKSMIVNGRLAEISNDLLKTQSSGTEKILKAIEQQRFYFFRNKPNIMFDRNTGLLWANLDTFDYSNNRAGYKRNVKTEAIVIDGINDWQIPTTDELNGFRSQGNRFIDSNNNIQGYAFVLAVSGSTRCYWYNYDTIYCEENIYDVLMPKYILVPCCRKLMTKNDYAAKANPKSQILTDMEKARLTLDLFIAEGLQPTFNDRMITDLFHKIFVTKPQLMSQLKEMDELLATMERKVQLTTDFDYLPLFAKYDVKAIDKSVIKYYQAVQQWTGEMLGRLESYEQENMKMIAELNAVSIKLSQKYVHNDKLTEEENLLLEKRQSYCQRNIAMGVATVKRQILSLKKQADAIEERLDIIDDGDCAIVQLGKLEKEPRVSFALLAENTARIIKNALKKMDYFRNHQAFIGAAVEAWESWSKDYLRFKTASFEQLRNLCQEDGVDDEVWQQWCRDWQRMRLQIEGKLLPLLARGLEGEISVIEEVPTSVIEQLLMILSDYKQNIDKFYLEDRKGIYQNFVFQAGGDLQDKFESELRLYRYTTKLQSDLQKVIFNCKETEDRMFILNWASDLLDIQINELLDFVADKDLQKISEKVLTDFSELRIKNLDAYICDVKAYGQEKERREKEYNSLMFKMRKALMK